jgi:exosortase/archaeosortase
MKVSKLIGLVALAAVAAGVLKNLPEIRRYIRLYTM